MTTDWVRLARSLADRLAAAGTLRTEAWREAVAGVPRHELVPRFYEQDGIGTWREVDGADPAHREEWLAAVYSDRPLVVALDGAGDGGRTILSSSTKPGLMVRMLEALDIRDGHRVLEVGTGTGYNAALLAHRLGDANVHSVDIDETLVTLARQRLAGLGLRPTLSVGDGRLDLPEHAPYDRIVVTCSVPAVSWDWALQTVVGGRVLVDVKTGQQAGNLVLLHRHPDRLEGRFLPSWAGFRSIRSAEPPVGRQERAAGDVVTTTTTLDPQPWANLVVWFMAQFGQPADLTVGFVLDDDGRTPVATLLTSPDGSWCEVGHRADGGAHRVTQAGTHRLWDAVEHADALWQAEGRPGWDRFGLTATPERQHVWLDRPDGPHQWDLV